MIFLFLLPKEICFWASCVVHTSISLSGSTAWVRYLSIGLRIPSCVLLGRPGFGLSGVRYLEGNWDIRVAKNHFLTLSFKGCFKLYCVVFKGSKQLQGVNSNGPGCHASLLTSAGSGCLLLPWVVSPLLQACWNIFLYFYKCENLSISFLMESRFKNRT